MKALPVNIPSQTGDRNNRRSATLRAIDRTYFIQQFKPIFVRHREIRKHQVRSEPPNRRNTLIYVLTDLYHRSQTRQIAGYRGAHVVLVINNNDQEIM